VSRARAGARGELIEGVDIGHLPDAGFVKGIDAEVTLVLGANHFGLPHETVDHRSSVPISGVRVTVVDDLIGRAVEAFSSPFAVEEFIR
jgi:hypothetical protein